MSLCIISQLLAFPDQIDTPQMRQGFIEYMNHMIKGKSYEGLLNIEAKLKDRALYSPQGLMATTKWLLAYGDFEKEETTPPEHAVFGVLYLCLIVSGFLGRVTKEDLPYDMVRNANFNSREDIGADFVRALYICTEVAKDRALYLEHDFVDFNTAFEKYYGYSIEQYTSVIFGLYAYFSNDSRSINANCFVKVIDIFSNTLINDIANKIIEEMMVTPEEARHVALDSLNDDWDFLLFWQKPFLTIDGEAAIPFAYRTLFSNFLIALKIKIEKCLTGKEKSRFHKFFGKVFEEYVSKVLERSVIDNQSLRMIDEFPYTGKKSPDAMLLFGKRKLFAFEAKGKYMRTPSVFKPETGPVLAEIERLIIEPLYQLHDRLIELIENPRPHLDFKKIGYIYLFSVSVSGISTNPPIQRAIAQRLTEKFSLPAIKGYYWLSIEEFEMLCSLIEHPPKGRSVFNVLDQITDSGHSFHNYMAFTYKVKRPRLLEEKHEEMFGKILNANQFKH
ncbi:MAG: hypothetical protein K0Q77_1832 [Anaerosporomusa subterranea]|jgi:hypothetical protein|nr:hypothetical protein [Anaerosporomusa subterranea]